MHKNAVILIIVNYVAQFSTELTPLYLLSVLRPAPRVQSKDCATRAIQGLVVHPYLAPLVRCNVRIAQRIWGLLCKAHADLRFEQDNPRIVLIRTLCLTYTYMQIYNEVPSKSWWLSETIKMWGPSLLVEVILLHGTECIQALDLLVSGMSRVVSLLVFLLCYQS